MACGWSGGGREGNYLLGERPLHGVARYSPSTGTEASHCSQWSRGIVPVALMVAVLISPELDPARTTARTMLVTFEWSVECILCVASIKNKTRKILRDTNGDVSLFK